MNELLEARKSVLKEITSEDQGARVKFLNVFNKEVQNFSDSMGAALLAWQGFDKKIGQNKNKGLVSALMFTTISLHIQSFKLFLSGHPVLAGNAQRQVVESIALTLLCSSHDLDVLNRFKEDKYRTHRAVADVEKHFSVVGLSQGGARYFSKLKRFYNKYSHPTLLTLTSMVSFSGDGISFYAYFDEGKLDGYEKEINGRVELANTFVDFIETVKTNVSKW